MRGFWNRQRIVARAYFRQDDEISAASTVAGLKPSGLACNRLALTSSVRIDFGHCLTDNSGNFLFLGCQPIIVAPTMNKSSAPRRKMVLPVKVTVDKITHLAHTVDITPTGARLVAYQTPLLPGMIVGLQRGSKKRDFQVQWVRRLSPNELQAGIECLQPQGNFWGVDLSDEGSAAAKESQQALMTLLSGRSKSVL